VAAKALVDRGYTASQIPEETSVSEHLPPLPLPGQFSKIPQRLYHRHAMDDFPANIDEIYLVGHSFW
jgi:hypothetical protein